MSGGTCVRGVNPFLGGGRVVVRGRGRWEGGRGGECVFAGRECVGSRFF